MELYNKYRPKTYEEMVGNEEAIESLKSGIEHGSHVFLFTGSAGCGKTTLAKIAAMTTLGASELSIHEINSSSNTGIDTVREIEKEVKFAPFDGAATIYILDEFHRQSAAAQDAALKVLEECPEWVYFFLCTTDPQKLVKPLVTRCSQVALKPLKVDQLTKLLRRVAHWEHQKVDISILEQVAVMAEGSSRQALKILSSILYLETDERRKDYLNSLDVNEDSDAIKLARVLAKGADWNTIAETLREIDLSEPEGVRQLVMSYANSILIKGNLEPHAIAMLQAFGNQNTFNNRKYSITIACLDYLDLLSS